MLVLGIYKFKFRIKTWHRFHEKTHGTQFSVGKKNRQTDTTSVLKSHQNFTKCEIVKYFSK